MTIDDKLENLANMLGKFISKTQENFDIIYKRFEQIDKRFEQIDKRFEQIDKRFEQIDKQLFEIRQDNSFFKSQLLHLEKSIYARDEQQVERHVFYLEQFKRLESRISALESNAA